MIQDRIDALIANAIKNKNELELQTYRAIKTAFMEYKTAKNAKPLNEAAELNIIRKMVKERRDTAAVYEEAGREELATRELAEAGLLETQFIPAQPDYEDIEAYALEIMIEKDPKKMGLYIKSLKEKFPTADGKVIANCVKSLL